jgi:hypothetical protein
MDETIVLDRHRGMAAQRATEIRRLLAEVQADEQALRRSQEALEAQLTLAPAEHWSDAADKARYLLALFAATPAAQDPRRQKLIANLMDDFTRLSLRDEADRASGEIPPPANTPQPGGSSPDASETEMAKGQLRGNRETKKPKSDKSKKVAALPTATVPAASAKWKPQGGKKAT